MTGTPILLAGASLEALPSGALHWPEERLLAVADLHLGRATRLARRGGALLPPYETVATLDRLAAEIARTRPEIVLCLGDSFDDDAAAGELGIAATARLTTLIDRRRWIWVAGNHDPAAAPGGHHCGEYARGPLTFRHEARPAAAPGEVSGHFHPKASLRLRIGAVRRPCFLHDGCRLILPAFGAYTGGLDCRHPALAGLMGPAARAILTGSPGAAVPLAATRKAG